MPARILFIAGLSHAQVPSVPSPSLLLLTARTTFPKFPKKANENYKIKLTHDVEPQKS